MVKETEQVKGWRSFRFDYGKPTETPPDESPPVCTCQQEKLCPGCFHTIIDVDELDQQ